MRRHSWLVLSLLLLAAPSAAEQPRCPLDVATCLAHFDAYRSRPWLGVQVDQDSAGRYVIVETVAGGPARRAGMKAGDVLETINGEDPASWFAGKAGWKEMPSERVAVRRGGRTVPLELASRPIPEDQLAKAIGIHMLEAHLAYAHVEEHGSR